MQSLRERNRPKAVGKGVVKMNRYFISAWVDSMNMRDLDECLACDLIAVWEGH